MLYARGGGSSTVPRVSGGSGGDDDGGAGPGILSGAGGGGDGGGEGGGGGGGPWGVSPYSVAQLRPSPDLAGDAATLNPASPGREPRSEAAMKSALVRGAGSPPRVRPIARPLLGASPYSVLQVQPHELGGE